MENIFLPTQHTQNQMKNFQLNFHLKQMRTKDSKQVLEYYCVYLSHIST